MGSSRPPAAACQVSMTQVYTKAELARATGDFSVDQQLGSGSFGEVFRAMIDGRQVAVKRLCQVDTRDAYENEGGGEGCLETQSMLCSLHMAELWVWKWRL